MNFKPPFHEKVLELALIITNQASNKECWEAHNQLRVICETHENTVLDHPFQWETLADFTIDSEEKTSAYLKGLRLAQQQNQFDYVASIAMELVELYSAKNDNKQVLAYFKVAKDALKHFEDSTLKMEIENIEKRIFQTRT